MYVKVAYPNTEVERSILQLARQEAISSQSVSAADTMTPLPQSVLFTARQEVLHVFTSEALEQYLVELVIATRTPGVYSQKLAQWLRFGASPRATIALDRCAKAHAWLAGRDYVSPEDIHAIVHDVLRHRILLTFAAEAEGIDCDFFIDELLRLVAIP